MKPLLIRLLFVLLVGLPTVSSAQWEQSVGAENTDANPFVKSIFDGEGDPGLPGGGGSTPESDNDIPFDGGIAVLLWAALYRRKAKGVRRKE